MLAESGHSLSPEEIWSRINLKRDSRALLIGGSQVGKSTLEERLLLDLLTRYSRPMTVHDQRSRRTIKLEPARGMVLDTKPRFRAQWFPNGMRTKGRYKNWEHGPTLPDSVVVEDPVDIDHVWTLGHRLAVVQLPEGGGIDLQTACLDKFIKQAKYSRPQVACSDETLDFFHSNGAPIGRPTLLKLQRAGTERGLIPLFCTQRTKGFNPAIMELMNLLYAFRLDNIGDEKRFGEFGCPPFHLPDEDKEFAVWDKLADRRRVYGPYRLTI